MHSNNTNKKGRFVLAMHSATETFGVGVVDYKNNSRNYKIGTFPIGRELSNQVFGCLQELLPKKNWREIARIAVTIGPGAYTGTRITVAIARTLAQQLKCDLDGISSFSLMASRLSKELENSEKNHPFWIKKNLPRKGIIAGRYQIKDSKILELKKPALYNYEKSFDTLLNATYDIEADTKRLLELSLSLQLENKKSDWKHILPIYPTSPISNK